MPPPRPQPVGDVLEDGTAEEVGFLKEKRRVQTGVVFFVLSLPQEAQLARHLRQKEGEQLQQRAFAASVVSDERNGPFVGDGERIHLQNGLVLIGADDVCKFVERRLVHHSAHILSAGITPRPSGAGRKRPS